MSTMAQESEGGSSPRSLHDKSWKFSHQFSPFLPSLALSLSPSLLLSIYQSIHPSLPPLYLSLYIINPPQKKTNNNLCILLRGSNINILQARVDKLLTLAFLGKTGLSNFRFEDTTKQQNKTPTTANRNLKHQRRSGASNPCIPQRKNWSYSQHETTRTKTNWSVPTEPKERTIV